MFQNITIYSGRHIFTTVSYCYVNIFNWKLFMLRIAHALCKIICNFFRSVLLEGIKRRSAPCHSIGIMSSQEFGAQARINFPSLSQFYSIPEWWHFPFFKISINRIRLVQLWRSSRHSRLPHRREQQSIELPPLPADRMYSQLKAGLEYI